MILNRSRRMYNIGKPGLLALIVLPVWAAFVLGGAALAEDASKPVTQTLAGECDKKVQVKVIALNGDAAAANADAKVRVFKMGDGASLGDRNFNFTTVDGGSGAVEIRGLAQAIIADDSDAPVEAMMRFTGCAQGEDIVQFGKDHPTADADSNGEVSETERGAYLIATAMNNPAALLTQFPEADRNEDGQLDAVEAGRLVTGAAIQFMRMKSDDSATNGPTPKIIVLNGPVGCATAMPKNICVSAIAKPGDEAAVAVGNAAVKLEDVTVNVGANVAWQAATSPSDWLLKNSSYVPAAIEVGRYVPTVEEASLAAFKDMHPEADTNNDGRVTTAERDTFRDAEMATVRTKLLKHFPAADANGDGTLTEEEMQAHFSKMSSSGGCAAKMGVWVAKDGDEAPVQIEVEPLEIKLETNDLMGPPVPVEPSADDRC